MRMMVSELLGVRIPIPVFLVLESASHMFLVPNSYQLGYSEFVSSP